MLHCGNVCGNELWTSPVDWRTILEDCGPRWDPRTGSHTGAAGYSHTLQASRAAVASALDAPCARPRRDSERPF